jgi:hypothetical protein
MRLLPTILAAAGAMTLATATVPAMAQPWRDHWHHHDWHDHDWHDHDWHRHYYGRPYYPGYAYAPPPPVYYAPRPYYPPPPVYYAPGVTLGFRIR